uniref:hypothetical protein n=1 Tax=Microvirga sp. Mcv34 TaxID=2926016 RepID=UPI0021C7D343
QHRTPDQISESLVSDRTLGKQVPEGEGREQLLEMARTWDSLAVTREGLVRNHPELNIGDTTSAGPPPRLSKAESGI